MGAWEKLAPFIWTLHADLKGLRSLKLLILIMESIRVDDGRQFASLYWLLRCVDCDIYIFVIDGKFLG